MFYVFPRVVDLDVCDDIVKSCKKTTLEKASVLAHNKSSRDDPKIRKTSISFIKDDRINELVWHFLKEANSKQFHYDLEYFLPIQFGEYKDGGFYDWHHDHDQASPSNKLFLQRSGLRNGIRKLSSTLVLSDPDTFEGGEFQFYNGGRPMDDMGDVPSEQIKEDLQAKGTIVVFDSRDWHRVTPVTKGVRHSVVCWCVGPNFK